MNKKEFIKQAKLNGYPTPRIKLRGICVIPRRKLHESGYKLMYVIGYNSDYKPYMISNCTDSITFTDYYTKQSFQGLQMDIDEEGIISLWSRYNLFETMDYNCSTIRFDVFTERRQQK